MSIIKSTHANVPAYRSILSDLFDTDSLFTDSFFRKENVPSVNVKETEKDYEIDIAAPGLKKEDFKLEVEKGVLSISGESKAEKEDKDKKFTRREFSYRSFSRSFELPANVDESNIDAVYQDGILKLTLKKTKEEKVNKRVINLK